MDELDYNYLAELVLKTQRGDSEAFAELYTATYQKQYRFTYRYAKDAYLAQDILQDVYILVLKNINTLKNPRLFVSAPVLMYVRRTAVMKKSLTMLRR